MMIIIVGVGMSVLLFCIGVLFDFWLIWVGLVIVCLWF